MLMLSDMRCKFSHLLHGVMMFKNISLFNETSVANILKRGIVVVVNNAAQIVPRRCSDEILRDSSLFFHSRKYKVAL